MSKTTCRKFHGKITAVHHEAYTCRVTVELQQSLAVTAGLMKESLVAMEVLESRSSNAQDRLVLDNVD